MAARGQPSTPAIPVLPSLTDHWCSLNRTTEAFVSELVGTEFKEWTVITVAHRLETIADFDMVLVLQDGQGVEYKSANALLAKERSIFRSLWGLQIH